MNILGIIAEYNPFHTGHSYHIQQSLKNSGCDYCTVVMSGDFVQRGEPAIFDKHTRAEFAVRAGVNLVIELPPTYSTQTAEVFSYGAIQILNSLNCITHIGFGCENSEDKIFKEIATLLCKEPEEYKKILHTVLDKGISYAVARETAIKKILPHTGTILSTPNNILAIEYYKQLYLSNSNILPILIKRKAVAHDGKETKDEYSSASNIRKMIYENKVEEAIKFIPKQIQTTLTQNIKRNLTNNIENYYHIIKILLYRLDAHQIRKYPDVEIGLENRIKNYLNKSASINELIDGICTKRYTKSRIRRILTNILLGLEDSVIAKYKEKESRYIRVLAFDDKGRKILREIKDNSEIIVVTNPKKTFTSLGEDSQNLLKISATASDIYYSQIQDKYKDDFRAEAIYVKK